MLKRIACGVCAAALSLLVVAPSVALATEVTPSSDLTRITSPQIVRYPSVGGTWTYGNWAFFIHSNYDHGSRSHRSSCELDGTYNTSIDTRAGEISYSRVSCPTDFPWENKQDSYWYEAL